MWGLGNLDRELVAVQDCEHVAIVSDDVLAGVGSRGRPSHSHGLNGGNCGGSLQHTEVRRAIVAYFENSDTQTGCLRARDKNE